MSSMQKGDKAVISETRLMSSGMIYKGTKVKVDLVKSDDRIRVTDEVGRVMWVKSSDILVY